MKLEGGSNVKSPWYHRTGARPLGVTRQIGYVASAVAPHAQTVRAQTSVTSTLNVYLGNVNHHFITTAGGAAIAEYYSCIGFDSTNMGFSMGFAKDQYTTTQPVNNPQHHIAEHMTLSGDTIYLSTCDLQSAAHRMTWNVQLSVEWYGR
jgi:hypothetical protein